LSPRKKKILLAKINFCNSMSIDHVDLEKILKFFCQLQFFHFEKTISKSFAHGKKISTIRFFFFIKKFAIHKNVDR
jgi:hypothetical protein